jgi:glycosyltransferase involved in cell wall biosynthesis
MKVLIFADFRSIHSRGWREGLESAGIEVVAVSSERVTDYDAAGPEDRVSSARQNHLDRRAGAGLGPGGRLLRAMARSQPAHTALNLARLRAQRGRLAAEIERHRPDVVHALRIPYEGLIALGIPNSPPVVVSTWGSDFVPMAAEDPLLSAWIRRLLPRAAGLQTDSLLDVDRAHAYGLPPSAAILYSASNFGVDDELFRVDPRSGDPLVLYPRKAKANANYRGFVAAATRIAATERVTFVGVGLLEVASALADEFGADAIARLELTDALPHDELARLMRRASVVVSPTYWDGTPISILEAVACGAAVVAGDLPELRRLRDDGLRIDLVDASDDSQIESAVRRALRAPDPARIAASLPPQFRRSRTGEKVGAFYSTAAARGR